MNRIALAIAAIVSIALPAAAARKALVIGNEAYSEGGLANPVRDAKAIAKKLRGLGFEVTLVTNATLGAMEDKIADYASNLSSRDESFVFYSGHGVQIKDSNFLLPVDWKARTEADAKARAYTRASAWWCWTPAATTRSRRSADQARAA